MRFILTVCMLLILPFAGSATAQAAAPGTGSPHGGTISGRILTRGGEPLVGGSVYFFNTAFGPRPDHEKYWRVPDFKRPLDAEGRFSLQLPDGKYYMGATRRVSGGMIGPPRDGDYYFISSDNKGQPVVYEVRGEGRVDLGAISGGEPFRSSTVNYGEGVTAMEGVVRDMEGKPVSGALVLAFVSAARGVRPLFTSEPTGKDGAFIIRVHDGGSYFLKVRSIYGGGPPVAGEKVGIFGANQPEAVTVKKGERLNGLTIRVSGFPGKGPQRGGMKTPQPGK
jgi:hypothetical protein